MGISCRSVAALHRLCKRDLALLEKRQQRGHWNHRYFRDQSIHDLKKFRPLQTKFDAPASFLYRTVCRNQPRPARGFENCTGASATRRRN